MDKQTESRSQFEAWFKFHSDEKECLNLLALNNAGSNYLNPHTDLAWIAWTASRESLVVELPVCADVNSAKSFAGRAMLTGKNSAITKCSEALRAIGIRIKGEGV
ncbi:hypothetical protein [Serratia fonticola]|uniref:hypothetical protein n=1 Tax=Serratia fonticola TaxID=47917 RepID=UPI000464AC5B|nr:hypothetical protein [Serratia fonticola]